MLHGQARAVLHAAAEALARPHHVLVQVDEHPSRLRRVLAEVPLLARELVHPPEADVALGPRDLALLDETGQRAPDLETLAQPLASSLAHALLLGVGGEHDLLVVDLACPGSSLRRGPARVGAWNELSMSTRIFSARRPRDASAPGAAARRDHHRERSRLPVLDTGDTLRRIGMLGPGHLIGRVEGLGPVGLIGEHAQRAALPHRLAGDRGSAPPSEHDLALHVLARVVSFAQCPRPRRRGRP